MNYSSHSLACNHLRKKWVSLEMTEGEKGNNKEYSVPRSKSLHFYTQFLTLKVTLSHTTYENGFSFAYSVLVTFKKKLLNDLGPFQTPLNSCAEPN